MIAPLRSRPGLRAAGRVAATVTALAAVSATVIVAADGGRLTSSSDQLLQADSGAPAPTGAADVALTGAEDVDLSGVQAAHSAAWAGSSAASSSAEAAASSSSAAASSAADARRRQAEQAVQAARQQIAAAARDAQRDPRGAARLMLANHGWGSGQFACLDALWTKESGWNYRAANPSSGAYGIAQALPGSKMASAGPDWQTNPVTQIAWGLSYIQGTYGSPCGAWAHSQAANWY